MIAALHHGQHGAVVISHVALNPAGSNSRPSRSVQATKLDGGRIRDARHLSTQRIDLPHDLALAQTADGRVARHLSHTLPIDRQEQGVHPKPRRSQRGLATGMARAHHHHLGSQVLAYGFTWNHGSLPDAE